MDKTNQIFEILKISHPTNSELANIIFGKSTPQTRGNIRKRISDIRKQKNVNITPNSYGRYTMAYIYTMEDQLSLNRLVSGKRGRPRKVA